jgi:hypothetical protein
MEVMAAVQSGTLLRELRAWAPKDPNQRQEGTAMLLIQKDELSTVKTPAGQGHGDACPVR